MDYECPSCKSLKHLNETIEIKYTDEIVKVVKCADCATVIDAQIERPKGRVLKWKRGAGEIRFSENERRNFASLVLTKMETQINLLTAIAIATGVDEEETEKIIKDQKENTVMYECLIRQDDVSLPPDIDD